MYVIVLENYHGDITKSTINTESIDEVLKEIKVLLNHFRVVKIKKKLVPLASATDRASVEAMDDS